MIAAAGFPRSGEAPILERLAQLGVPLADLTADSRAVKLGSVFAAYPGTVRDGRGRPSPRGNGHLLVGARESAP